MPSIVPTQEPPAEELEPAFKIDWDHPEEFPYRDERGCVIYKNVRYTLLNLDGSTLLSEKGKPDKTFRQYRLEGGRWVRGLKSKDGTVNVAPVPYRLPELIAAVKSGRRRVFVTEGEAKADKLRALGFIATSIATKGCAEAHAELFRGVEVALLPDNDEKGTARADEIGAALVRGATRIGVIKLPRLQLPGDDILDWPDKYGGTAKELVKLYEDSPVWQPPQGGAAGNGHNPRWRPLRRNWPRG
jgi:hypothetical protein